MKILALLAFLPTLLFAEWADWDRAQQEQFKMFLGLQIVDLTQTMAAIDCQKHPECPLEENNPLLGSRPDDDGVLVQKVLTSYLVYKLLDRESEYRRGKMLTWINATFVIIVTNNGIQLRKVFK